MRASFNGSGHCATNAEMGVRFPPPVPEFCGPVAERQRHLAVYQDEDGSTPFRLATSLSLSSSGVECLILSQEIAGSNPARDAKLWLGS
jgi:hypothetical protein